MNILQRSDDWYAERCGKVTASRVKDLNAKPSKGKALNALGLTILAERLTGVQKETPTNFYMQWGIDNEQHAIAAYENETGYFVNGTGLIDHPFIEMFGASPDGLVGENGQIEVKCPDTTTHLNTLLTKEVPDEYIPQITSQLACTRREWCDFVSYDPRLEPELQIIIIRVFAKDLNIEGLERDVRAFNRAIEEAKASLKVAA
ncbi:MULTISPECIES: lambda exonuclease family protein [Acinetobacter]|uniref:Exonuclease n=1 Tax=Acinetobacter junii TaxID=40215 RepID=A0A365PMH8_ACIJU|nr:MULTISPECIES: lambda exonuclease family protein [Acinetobacter]RBA42363.1 exonuclease [Acinetobacter junii]RBA42933.1 exonuclease [Acinetobacter junii]RBA49838.1 exonuclease [Acinetobacter junii]WLF73442.1 YqaJ viral recombinase family protein [Acinetobacter junii]